MLGRHKPGSSFALKPSHGSRRSLAPPVDNTTTRQAQVAAPMASTCHERPPLTPLRCATADASSHLDAAPQDKIAEICFVEYGVECLLVGFSASDKWATHVHRAHTHASLCCKLRALSIQRDLLSRMFVLRVCWILLCDTTKQNRTYLIFARLS